VKGTEKATSHHEVVPFAVTPVCVADMA